MPWQVFYKMYRPPSPPSSDISYTVKPEFPKYLLQISLKPRPPDSVLKLDSLVPRDIKIHPCNVKMWNAAPVTRKIQILRPNSPLSTHHATSGSQNQKSQKEETMEKNTHTKNHKYYINFWDQIHPCHCFVWRRGHKTWRTTWRLLRCQIPIYICRVKPGWMDQLILSKSELAAFFISKKDRKEWSQLLWLIKSFRVNILDVPKQGDNLSHPVPK